MYDKKFFFTPLFFCCFWIWDPGWIKIRIRDPGWVKIRIRDKYPGSATLLLHIDQASLRRNRRRLIVRLIDWFTCTLVSQHGTLVRQPWGPIGVKQYEWWISLRAGLPHWLYFSWNGMAWHGTCKIRTLRMQRDSSIKLPMRNMTDQ